VHVRVKARASEDYATIMCERRDVENSELHKRLGKANEELRLTQQQQLWSLVLLLLKAMMVFTMLLTAKVECINRVNHRDEIQLTFHPWPTVKLLRVTVLKNKDIFLFGLKDI